jgi:small subunit ribosomal protein S14
MAKKCMQYREKRRRAHPSQVRNRCQRCGRPRGFIRRFGLCRICFRELALTGQNPRRRKGVLVAPGGGRSCHLLIRLLIC